VLNNSRLKVGIPAKHERWKQRARLSGLQRGIQRVNYDN